MARIRTIKPEAFKDGDLWDLGTKTGLPVFQTFAALWCQADREGRFEWKPRELKIECLPYWNGDFEEVLATLEAGGFIESYVVRSRRYAWIPTFAKHQKPHPREADSTIPAPPGVTPNQQSTTKAVPGHDLGTAQPGKGFHAPSLPFPDPDPEGVQGEPKVNLVDPTPDEPIVRRPDPTADSFNMKLPGDRTDVQELHRVFATSIGQPDRSLRGRNSVDCHYLAEAIDAHGMQKCLLVARECMSDRMVTGEADDKGMSHKSPGYVFGNESAFNRILAKAKAKERKSTEKKTVADLRRETAERDADLSDYRPPKAAQ